MLNQVSVFWHEYGWIIAVLWFIWMVAMYVFFTGCHINEKGGDGIITGIKKLFKRRDKNV